MTRAFEERIDDFCADGFLVVRGAVASNVVLACVDVIVTDLAVIDVKSAGLHLREVAPGWTAEEVQKATGAPLIAKSRLEEISFV